MIEKTLPWIGSLFLLIITLVNYIGQSNIITGIVSITLFSITLVLFIISKLEKHKTRKPQ